MKLIRIFITAVCVVLATVGALRAGAETSPVITLISLDGSVVVVGEFRGFEEGHYNMVVAGLGLISIDESLVTCHSSIIDCAALVSSS